VNRFFEKAEQKRDLDQNLKKGLFWRGRRENIVNARGALDIAHGESCLTGILKNVMDRGNGPYDPCTV
jgi:hypothetical protein